MPLSPRLFDLIDGPFVLFLGRQVEQKGADLLLDALEYLPDRGGTELVIAGDGPQKADWQARAQHRFRQGRVCFLPWVEGDEKVALLQHAAVVAIPSRHFESFGLVGLESLAAGKPVLASNLPGLVHSLGLCPAAKLLPADEPRTWALHLQAHLDGHVSPWTADDARRYAAAFDWTVVAHQHLVAYEKVASDPKSGASLKHHPNPFRKFWTRIVA